MESLDLYLTPLAILLLASLVHASFQLSISVLTSMSGHAIGKRTSLLRLLRISTGFIAGVFVTTMLVVAFLAYTGLALHTYLPTALLWSLIAGMMIGVGIAVWIFYYRRELGTVLWVPRSMARFLEARARATRHASEGFSLGSTSVLAELLFTLAPSLAAAYSLLHLPMTLQIAGILGYTLIATLPLVIVYALISSGHKISRIQRWRETNKRFLQFAAGSGLLVLGFFIYAYEVLGVKTLGGGF